MDELKPCPCGETPTNIEPIGNVPEKWMYAVPDCCSEWEIEFRAQYERDPEKLSNLAADAWNDAPRHQPGLSDDKPKFINRVSRLEDMSAVGRLTLMRDDSGDIVVTVNEQTDDGLVGVGASVEFCTVGTGGGCSPQTFKALLRLMEAMDADNNDPDYQGRSIKEASGEG